MKNPFQYGKIAEQDNFIDRDSDRAFLKNTLYSGTNVILMSPRRWGKSSLVKQSMKELRQEHPDVVTVNIDAFPITSSKEFYAVFMREVLRASSSHAEAVLYWVGRFLKTITPKISFSMEPMSEFSFSVDLGEAPMDTEAILALPEKIAQEKGLQIIVCIDEFQKLAKLSDYDKLEGMMRSVWQHQQHVSYCLYGSQRHMMTEIFDSPEKPFYRFGQMYHLKKIAEGDWIEYICKRFGSTGKSISIDLAREITRLAECHSWYVQQLASAVWNYTESVADERSLRQALDWCVDVNSEAYIKICDVFTEAQIGLLRAIAMFEDNLSSGATIKKYKLGTSAAVTKNKRMLVNGDIVTLSSREKPRFLDPIFAVWFRQNYL